MENVQWNSPHGRFLYTTNKKFQLTQTSAMLHLAEITEEKRFKPLLFEEGRR